jgi:hypothetical protein
LFGDALSYIYIDRFDLKQLAFNIEDQNPKNSSGFISDKDGFQNELAQLKKFLSDGFPCMLCDISNSIRYGDILMLFSGGRTIIIECKNKLQNSMRERRQAETLKKLMSYYDLDQKKMDKGLLTVTRSEYIIPFVSYEAELNMLISEAKNTGVASAQIEKGLYYFVTSGLKTIESQLKKYKIKKPWIVFLNQYKFEDNWLSYLPYTLSINKPEDLVDFILGDLSIIIIVDISIVRNILSKENVLFQENEFGDFPFEFYIRKKPTNEIVSKFSISEHILMRVFLEFVSLNWVVRDSYERWISKQNATF